MAPACKAACWQPSLPVAQFFRPCQRPRDDAVRHTASTCFVCVVPAVPRQSERASLFLGAIPSSDKNHRIKTPFRRSIWGPPWRVDRRAWFQLVLKWRVLEFRGTKRPPKNRYTSQIDQQVRSMRVPREKKMKSKEVRKFLPATLRTDD